VAGWEIRVWFERHPWLDRQHRVEDQRHLAASQIGLAELPKSLFLSFHHDEDITVFLNGRQILHRTGYSTYYQTEDVTDSAIPALQTGQNVLAVHVKQTIGGQFFDLSLRGFAKPVNLDHLINKHGKEVLSNGRFNLYKKDKGYLPST
jgi:hypothetical protein